jgi:hypothetical protein
MHRLTIRFAVGELSGQIDPDRVPGSRDFGAELRDELLNGKIFYSLKEAQIVIGQ